MQFHAPIYGTALAALTLAATSFTFAQAAPQQEVPSAPSATAAQAPQPVQFPPVNPANFTSDTPSKETVESFLKESWGYDANRIWQVAAIQKTPAEGIVKVVVYVAEKQSAKPEIANLTFFVTPDGKHLIANDVLPFGAHPYAEYRELLKARATGPSLGATDKQFQLVEFADFQCPHCKDAQQTAAKLQQDFPQARYVYENFPLVTIHSEAYKAAAYGACVAKESGNDAFFKFSDAIFAAQENLTPTGSDTALADAVTKAGLTPAKVATCANSSEGKSTVDASLQLGKDLNVDQTPMLFINGRAIPMNAVPYEQLKQIVAYQFSLDK